MGKEVINREARSKDCWWRRILYAINDVVTGHSWRSVVARGGAWGRIGKARKGLLLYSLSAFRNSGDTIRNLRAFSRQLSAFSQNPTMPEARSVARESATTPSRGFPFSCDR